jgi:hypothetical protein
MHCSLVALVIFVLLLTLPLYLRTVEKNKVNNKIENSCNNNNASSLHDSRSEFTHKCANQPITHRQIRDDPNNTDYVSDSPDGIYPSIQYGISQF